jgi:hypothetical protein
VAIREQQADEKEADLEVRETEVSQREETFADGLKRFNERKNQMEADLRERKEDLVTMITHEQGQRDEVEVALAYVTDVSPALINPSVRGEIIRHLEKCLERWAVNPKYDSHGRYIRTVHRS